MYGTLLIVDWMDMMAVERVEPEDQQRDWATMYCSFKGIRE